MVSSISEFGRSRSDTLGCSAFWVRLCSVYALFPDCWCENREKKCSVIENRICISFLFVIYWNICTYKFPAIKLFTLSNWVAEIEKKSPVSESRINFISLPLSSLWFTEIQTRKHFRIRILLLYPAGWHLNRICKSLVSLMTYTPINTLSGFIW